MKGTSMGTTRYETGAAHPADHFVYRIDGDTGARTPYAQAFSPEAATRIADVLTKDAAGVDSASEVERPNPFRTNPLGDTSRRARSQVANAHGPGVNITQAGGDVVLR